MHPARHAAAAARGAEARAQDGVRVRAAARAVLRAPLARRSWAEAAYLTVGVPLTVAGFLLILLTAVFGAMLCASLAGVAAGLALLTATTVAGRGLAAVHRRLAAALPGWPPPLPGPAPFVPGRGLLGRVDARLRDGPGWRGACYVLLRLPLALASLYAVAGFWVIGLYYLTYPAWWSIAQAVTGPGEAQSPVSSPLPAGGVRIASWPGALGISLLGVVVLLAAPWAVRAVVLADRWLIRRMLTGRPLSERVRELQASRAQAVDDTAALLRRVERDLHDGAQARLVAVAMQLGLAREKLAADGPGTGAGGGAGGADPDRLDRVRELIDAAHRGAKEALTELRDLARGIHPPALDHGLAEALATLAARSAVPATLTADVPVRPTPAIETIAYFCAAELLANVAKHSGAGRAAIGVTAGGAALRLSVTDDGAGGAVLRPGGGLAGLAQRVAVVDGALAVSSPDGGPTVVTVDLPLHA
ncbi:MAG TPA: sensor domain-containing protein [Streptosporangiaceae bacterium]|jgi:signal transduction histidine kinase